MTKARLAQQGAEPPFLGLWDTQRAPAHRSTRPVRDPVLPGRHWTWEGTWLKPWAGMLAKLRAATANKQRKVVGKASGGQEQSLRQGRSKQATTGSH